jgi:hypothetical protein
LYNSVMQMAYLSKYVATWFFSFNSSNFKKHRHGCMELKFKISILKFCPINKWALRKLILKLNAFIYNIDHISKYY